MAATPQPNDTSALCIRCAGYKSKALGPCGACGYLPDYEEAITLSLALSRQFSTSEELETFAHDIRAKQPIAPPAPILARVRKVAKAILARDMSRGTESKPDLAAVGSTDQSINASVSPLFSTNPFYVLGATPLDTRKRIVELADERALDDAAGVIAKASSELTHPRARLSSEMGWLPGVSPKRGREYIEAVTLSPKRAFELKALPPLPLANILAAALDSIAVTEDALAWPTVLQHFSHVIESIDSDAVRRHVNEDRTVAGFPEVSSMESIEAEVTVRRNIYKNVVRAWLDRFPAGQLLEILTATVDTATASGTRHAPRLIEETVIDYELSAQPALSKADEAISKLVDLAKANTSKGAVALNPIIDELERFTKQWDLIAKPAQLCAKARGEEHAASRQLAYRIRSLGIDLANDHQQYEMANRLTGLLSDVFAEVPEVADKVTEDASTLQTLLAQQQKAIHDKEAYERDITYSADVGLLFKTRLAISPQGLEWGSQRYPLESVTRVRWGAVKHSVNFIPTGTTYHLAFGDNSSLAVFELSKATMFSEFVEKLWRAVGWRMMVRYAQGFRSGKSFRFGEIEISDDGCEIPVHKFIGTDRIKLPWSELHIWSSNGNCVVGAKSNKKAYGAASYKDGDNTHLLESMIRIFFKDSNARRVSDAFLT